MSGIQKGKKHDYSIHNKLIFFSILYKKRKESKGE